MVKIKPFQAIRPNSYDVDQVASLPYDVVSPEQARKWGEENPKTFLHIDRAEVDLPQEVDPHDKKVYVKAQKNLDMFLEQGWLMKEKEPAYYLYRLKRNNRSQYGLVMTIDIDEYFSNQIKKHESTRPDKEQDRIHHNDTCDANTSPIFLTYPDHEKLNDLIQEYKDKKLPIYAFESFYDVQHYVWKISDSKLIERITEIFATDIDSLYIADGHHRMESAAKVAQMRRKEIEEAGSEAEFNYFLGVAFPQSQLEILPYNRLVKGKMTPSSWKILKEKFTVEPVFEDCFEPKEIGTIGMYVDKNWYRLKIKEEKVPQNKVDSLDVSLLQNYILEPLFGIENPRTDERIEFVGGIHDIDELVTQARAEKGTIAFSMYPTLIKDITEVSDAGEMMPPKSTWFEPKLLSGLFLHSFDSASM